MKNNQIKSKEQWILFLNNKENDFDTSFIDKATHAIEWTDGEGTILPSSFKDIDLPDKFFIPDSIYSIGKQAFSDAVLPIGFVIPTSILDIGENAFENIGSKRMVGNDLLLAIMCGKRGRSCNKMEEFFIAGDYKTFLNLKIGGMNMNNIIMANDFLISDTTKSIIVESLWKKRLPNSLTIPSSVVSFHGHSFAWSLIPMGFNIPPTVKNIESNSFEGAKLQEGFKIDNYSTWIGLIKGGIRKSQLIMADTFSFPEGMATIDETAFESVTLSKGFEIPKL